MNVVSPLVRFALAGTIACASCAFGSPGAGSGSRQGIPLPDVPAGGDSASASRRASAAIPLAPAIERVRHRVGRRDIRVRVGRLCYEIRSARFDTSGVGYAAVDARGVPGWLSRSDGTLFGGTPTPPPSPIAWGGVDCIEARHGSRLIGALIGAAAGGVYVRYFSATARHADVMIDVGGVSAIPLGMLIGAGTAGFYPRWPKVWPSGPAPAGPSGDVTTTLAATGFVRKTKPLDQGGSAGHSSGTLSASVTRRFMPAFSAGLALRHEQQAWSVAAGSSVFGPFDLWNNLRRTSASLTSSLALSKRLVIGVSPSVEWARDGHARFSDGRTYGVVLSGFGVLSPAFVLGGGASVARQFYSVKTSPFAIVNWRLAERWRIANTFPVGPQGGAGVELRYTLTSAMELAGGGVYRSDRYRLGPFASFPGGVGVASDVPLFARWSLRIEPGIRIDAYVGTLMKGKVEVRDNEGRLMGRDRYGPAPALAMTVSRKFE
jgi:hypothetical protein